MDKWTASWFGFCAFWLLIFAPLSQTLRVLPALIMMLAFDTPIATKWFKIFVDKYTLRELALYCATPMTVLCLGTLVNRTFFFVPLMIGIFGLSTLGRNLRDRYRGGDDYVNDIVTRRQSRFYSEAKLAIGLSISPILAITTFAMVCSVAAGVWPWILALLGAMLVVISYVEFKELGKYAKTQPKCWDTTLADVTKIALEDMDQQKKEQLARFAVNDPIKK